MTRPNQAAATHFEEYPAAGGKIWIDGTGRSAAQPGFSESEHPERFNRAIRIILNNIRRYQIGQLVYDLYIEARPPSPVRIIPSLGGYRGCIENNWQGAMPIIRFAPKRFTNDGTSWADARTSLLHELFHAYRYLSGQLSAGSPPPAGDSASAYPKSEEFYAVVVENIFASEVGLILRDGYGWRSDQSTFSYLPIQLARSRNAQSGSALSTVDRSVTLREALRSAGLTAFPEPLMREFSVHFATRHEAALVEFTERCSQLCSRLRSLNQVWFNPIRDLAEIRAGRRQRIP